MSDDQHEHDAAEVVEWHCWKCGKTIMVSAELSAETVEVGCGGCLPPEVMRLLEATS